MDLLKKDDELLKYKYGINEDPSFSAAKNKKIVEESIAKAEIERFERVKLWNESMRDRADAIATFSINCLATKLSFKVLEKSLTSKVQIIDVQNLLFPMTKEERKLV